MRILFDHNVPAPLLRFLQGHQVVRARELGWDRLPDAGLLTQAEQSGFDVLISGDQRIYFQQNLANRNIAIVVLTKTNWNVVERYVRRIAVVVDTVASGTYTEVQIPFR